MTGALSAADRWPELAQAGHSRPVSDDDDDLVPPDPARANAATELARELLLAGTPDDDVVWRLQRTTDEPSLRRAAALAGKYAGFPGTRIRLVLGAAAEGRPIEPLSEEQREADEAERRLLTAPPAAAWELLAVEVPELAALAARIEREGAGPRPGLLTRLRSGGERRASLRGVLAAARHLVGPESGQNDPLLASPAAAFVASRHLVALLEQAEARRQK